MHTFKLGHNVFKKNGINLMALNIKIKYKKINKHVKNV